MTSILIMGLATAFNILVILFKLKLNRKQDALLDISLFVSLSYLFSGSITGLQVAMIASFIISLSLFFIDLKSLFWISFAYFKLYFIA